MYKKSLENGKLPSTVNEAVITLIPKKEKDLEQVGSYRPVSLLNSDLKILAETLALRLSPLVTKLVHPDQTGFIPGSHLFHNVRRLLNILYSPRHPKEDLFHSEFRCRKGFLLCRIFIFICCVREIWTWNKIYFVDKITLLQPYC